MHYTMPPQYRFGCGRQIPLIYGWMIPAITKESMGGKNV